MSGESYLIAGTVVDTELDDGSLAILDVERKLYFSLNLTGADIWQAIKRGICEDVIVERLVAKFDVTEEQARENTRDLVQQLLDSKLLTVA